MHALGSSPYFGIGLSRVRRGVRRSLDLERRGGSVVHATARGHAPYFARGKRERGGVRRCVVRGRAVRRFVLEQFERLAPERHRAATVLPFSLALSGFVQWL